MPDAASRKDPAHWLVLSVEIANLELSTRHDGVLLNYVDNHAESLPTILALGRLLGELDSQLPYQVDCKLLHEQYSGSSVGDSPPKLRSGTFWYKLMLTNLEKYSRSADPLIQILRCE